MNKVNGFSPTGAAVVASCHSHIVILWSRRSRSGCFSERTNGEFSIETHDQHSLTVALLLMGFKEESAEINERRRSDFVVAKIDPVQVAISFCQCRDRRLASRQQTKTNKDGEKQKTTNRKQQVGDFRDVFLRPR